MPTAGTAVEGPELDSKGVFVRTKTRDQAEAFYKAGAEYVIVPDELAAGALLETLESVFADDITPEDLRQSELLYSPFEQLCCVSRPISRGYCK